MFFVASIADFRCFPDGLWLSSPLGKPQTPKGCSMFGYQGSLSPKLVVTQNPKTPEALNPKKGCKRSLSNRNPDRNPSKVALRLAYLCLRDQMTLKSRDPNIPLYCEP